MLRQLEEAELRSSQLGSVALESALESSAFDSIDSHPSNTTKGGAPISVVVTAGKPAGSFTVKSSGQKPVAESLVRITGLDDRETDECFETEFTARTNPHRGYITIIEGCDKFCSYCVVPYTRGKERSRTSASVLAEARQMADLGYTEIQLLGQNVNSYKDSEGNPSLRKNTLPSCWPPWAKFPASAACAS